MWKQGEFLLSKAQEIEASNRKKWNFMVELWFLRKNIIHQSYKKLFIYETESISVWGKHHITVPFHTWENKRLEIKWGGGPFQDVDIQSWLHLNHVQTSQPSTLLPLAPGCYPGILSQDAIASES